MLTKKMVFNFRLFLFQLTLYIIRTWALFCINQVFFFFQNWITFLLIFPIGFIWCYNFFNLYFIEFIFIDWIVSSIFILSESICIFNEYFICSFLYFSIWILVYIWFISILSTDQSLMTFVGVREKVRLIRFIFSCK